MSYGITPDRGENPAFTRSSLCVSAYRAGHVMLSVNRWISLQHLFVL